MDVNGDSGENSVSKKERWKENLHLLREYINNYEQNVGNGC